MTRFVFAIVAVALVLGLAVPAHAGDLPAWARPLMNAAGDAAPAAIVLLDELNVAVDRSGRLRSVQRYAVRVNSLDGRTAAAVRQVYIEGSGKITGLKAWMLRPGGRVTEYGGREVFEVALVDGDLYNEIRAKGIDASRDVEAGSIFVAELESEEAGLFAQIEWPLQERWSVRLARRTLALPDRWTARSVTFNANPLEPTINGSTFVWEARDLHELQDEAAAPSRSSRVPRLAVSYFAPAGERIPGQFATWADVAVWLHAASEPAAGITDALARAARDVTAGAATEIEKVQAVARFVQRVQYVSIQTGLGRGGGYQPRPAAQTLEKRYGDCKDKANLMRALLAVVGIKAHLVAIYAGDPRHVREEWPSPQQFNHCIIAIVLTQPMDGGTVATHPVHGRLLFFDPTDEHGRVGELPLGQQGSLALLQLPGAALERVPMLATSASRIERSVDAALAPTGTLSATIVERRFGGEAAAARARTAGGNEADMRRWFEQQIAALAPGANLVRHAAEEQVDSGGYTVSFEAGVPRYGQVMQGRLMLVPPPTTSGLAVPTLAPGRRLLPVDLETQHTVETITLRLPDGFAVDEVPPAAALETPYGRFSMTVKNAGDGVIVTRRELETPRALVPPADYAALRTFFDRVRSAASAPIVLVKQ